MTRSFTDRVLAGVCGGVGAALRIDPWLLRGAFIVLVLISGGALAMLYVALWWALPQQSLVMRRGSGVSFFYAFLLVLGFIGLWLAGVSGVLAGPTGMDFSAAALLALLSSVFILQQLRG